jgi:hypothetical protein
LWLLYGESRPWRKERNRIRKVQPEVAASLDVSVSPQAVEQRFGEESATLLREVLHSAVAEVLCGETRVPELLSRFNGVYVQEGRSSACRPNSDDDDRIGTTEFRFYLCQCRFLSAAVLIRGEVGRWLVAKVAECLGGDMLGSACHSYFPLDV